MPGPAPDPGSIREAARLESGAIRTLPQSATAPAPAWPLTKASRRELVVWRRLWKKPQAVVWAEQGADERVAMHVRTFCEAEVEGATAAVRSLLLRQETALLLTHSALLSAGFRVSSSAPAATAGGASALAARRQIPSSRGRLQAVDFRDRWRPPSKSNIDPEGGHDG